MGCAAFVTRIPMFVAVLLLEKLNVMGEYSVVPVTSPTGYVKANGDAGNPLTNCPIPLVTIIALVENVPVKMVDDGNVNE